MTNKETYDVNNLAATLEEMSPKVAEHKERIGHGFGEPVAPVELEDAVARALSSRPLTPAEITAERKQTHGDWMQQSQVANDLKRTVRTLGNWDSLGACQQEALDMILTKVSRIVSGDPHEPDHWDDIAGYAFLGTGGHAA